LRGGQPDHGGKDKWNQTQNSKQVPDRGARTFAENPAKHDGRSVHRTSALVQTISRGNPTGQYRRTNQNNHGIEAIDAGYRQNYLEFMQEASKSTVGVTTYLIAWLAGAGQRVPVAGVSAP
jgi:hypothetical protein